MKKRIISLLLVVAMIISVIPVIASAEAVETAPSFKSVSLTLDGILRLNVKVNPGSVSDMAGYKVKFTVGEETPWECTEPTQQDNLYVYTAKIPAHKLHKTVKVELLDAENKVIDESSWTLDAYNAAIIAWDSGMTGLANSLDMYAKNAAAYAANSESIVPETAVSQETLVDYQIEKETPEATVTPIAKLLLNDACTLRVQVKANDFAEGYSLKICGEAKELEYDETNSVYYYDIKDIRAQDWGTKYDVEIVDGEGETLYKCKYAVMSYVYSVLGVPESYANELNLLKSMYLYFNEADNYKNAERYDYSLTYNANYEGTEETKVDTANITGTNKNFAVAANSFVRPGYKFVGWNTKADGTGTSYAVGDTVALQAAQTLLDEEFNNAISDKWTAYHDGNDGGKANWFVKDGALMHSDSEKSANIASVMMLDTVVNAENYEITADIVIPKDSTNYSIGLMFADNHFMRIWKSGTTYFLYYGTSDDYIKNRTETKVELKGTNVSIGSGNPVAVKIKVEGNKYSIYLNDTLVTNTPVASTKDQLTGKVGVLVRSPDNDTKACFKNINVVSASNMTETLYAQWEELPLFSQNLGTLEELPSTWTHYNNGSRQANVSAWSANNGVMTCSVSSNSQVLQFGTINEENYEITANVLMQTKGSLGLAFADNQYFRIWWNGSGYRLLSGWYKTSGGPYQYLEYYTGYSSSSCPTVKNLSAGSSATLKLKVEGNKFTISVNDQSWTIEADKTLTGQFGLFQSGADGAEGVGFGFKDINVVKIVPAAE